MYEPDEGDIYPGERERSLRPTYTTKLNIGMVHQHFPLVSNHTIAENIVWDGTGTKEVLGFSLGGYEEGQ